MAHSLTPSYTTTATTLFAGTGELCAQLRSRDWSQTPLGSVEQWSPSLCTLLRTLLHSPSPMHLLWGSHRTPFYNDRWAALLGISPQAPTMQPLNQTLGAEAAASLETWVTQVITEGSSIQRDRLRVRVRRPGGTMEAQFTVCLSPVWDETGTIAGVLGVWTETPDRRGGDRRLETLHQLITQTQTATSISSVYQRAMTVLAANPVDMPLALLYRVDETHTRATLTQWAGIAPGSLASPLTVPLSPHAEQPEPVPHTADVWSLAAIAATGQPIRITNVERHMGKLVGAGGVPIQTVIGLPITLHERDHPLAILVIGLSQPLTQDEPHPDFLDLVVYHIARAVADVQTNPTEGLFITLAEAVPATIFRFNADNECIYVNNHWSEMTGRDRSAAMEMGWLETLHPDDRDRLTDAWLTWCDQADPRSLYHNEGRILRADGSVVWFYVQALSEVNAQGTRQGYIGVLTDITHLKQVETHLRDTQQQLQQQLAEIEAIYQSAPIALNVLDTDLRFVRLNQRLAEMNGLAIADHLGRSVREVMPHLADAAEAVLARILATGEPLMNVEITGETLAQPGVQRTWLEHFLPLRNGDRIIGISTVCEEITGRKRVEAELQQAKADLELRVAERTEELRRINATLQHSESTLRSFFNSEGSLMAIVELYENDLWLVSVNHEMAEFWDSTVSQLQHSFVSDLDISPTEIQEWLQHYRNAHHLQKPVKFECHREANGESRWLSSSICPIAVSPSGHPRFSYIAKDISDRKQMESDLQASEARYRGIVQDQTELIVRFNPDNTILFANDAYCRFVGYTLNDAIGTHYGAVIHPDDREYVLQQINTMNATHLICEIENRVINAQGEMRWTQWVNRLLLSPEGQKIEVQSVGRDITDLKLAEQALRHSEERLQLALEASGDGIWDWNVATNDIYFSPQYFQMLGYRVDELPHTVATWKSLIHPDDQFWVMDILDRHFVDSEVRYEFDHRLRTKTGTWKWVANYGKVVARDPTGKPLRMIGTHQDVSDRKYAQERIAASLREKEVLLKEIHHRVKNNLQIVDGLLKMQSRRSTDPQISAVLRDSQSRIASIALVHEKLYRSDELANIDFGQYLRDLTIHLFESYNVSSDRIQLQISVHGVHLEIETAIPCGLIVNELVSNSLKYAFPADRKGSIVIDLQQIAVDHFTLIVQDDGIGLPSTFNIRKTRSLGMTLLQGLVDQLEGNLIINTQNGTTFTISFSRKLIK